MSASNLSRREVLKGAAGLITAAALEGCAGPARQEAAPGDRVRRENTCRGTRDWLLTKTRIDPATKYRSPCVEGYCSRSSVRAGETLEVFASAQPATEVTIDVYRLGWYGGDGGRHVLSLGPIRVSPQPDPPVGEKRLRDCSWAPAASIQIPADWLSGVYVGKLTEQTEKLQSYVIFVVRDDRRADYLFQVSDHTWQAYNRWPSQFSLYDDGKSQWYWGGNVQISFNRPYGKYCQILDQPLSIGSGEWFLWEFPMAFWMEERGLDVTYCSNQDTHADPQGLLRTRGFLSVGHDEYWSLDMFRNVEAAIARGVNAAFFSGNAACGKIALSPDGKGVRDRVFERVGVFGPPGGTRDFDSMKTLAHNRPYANELLGAHSTGPVTGGADWTCARPEHWAFEGTGMKAGDGIPGLVGWEWHGDPAPIPGLEIVATGPTQDAPGKPNGGVFTATVYPGPRGNFVFNASTCWWADSLGAPPGYVRPSVYTSPQGPDSRAQRITANVLERMLAAPDLRGSLPPGASARREFVSLEESSPTSS